MDTVEDKQLGSDILWGAEAIGNEIGKTEREAYYLLEKRLIPGEKVGRQWASSRSALRQRFATLTGKVA